MKRMETINKDKNFHLSLAIILGILLIWSGLHPADRFTWFLEVAPIFIISAILLWIYRQFYFSRLVCYMMAAHAIVLGTSIALARRCDLCKRDACTTDYWVRVSTRGRGFRPEMFADR